MLALQLSMFRAALVALGSNSRFIEMTWMSTFGSCACLKRRADNNNGDRIFPNFSTSAQFLPSLAINHLKFSFSDLVMLRVILNAMMMFFLSPAFFVGLVIFSFALVVALVITLVMGF